MQITNASGTDITGTAIGNDLMYTGREYDAETGNYFYRARYYNPDLGRFISRDPLSGAEFSQGTNLYAYCGNNFLNRFDQTGMCVQFGLDLSADLASINLGGTGEESPGVQNASTELDTAGLLATAAAAGGKVGDNLGLYSEAFNGNQYVGIAADLGKVSEALGAAGTLGAVALDISSKNYRGAAKDTAEGVAAYVSPVAGAAIAGYTAGTLIDKIPTGDGNNVGGRIENGAVSVMDGSAGPRISSAMQQAEANATAEGASGDF